MGRLANVMSRARAAGWGATRADAWWQQSGSNAAARTLDGFPVDRVADDRDAQSDDDQGAAYSQSEGRPLATSMGRPVQQYLADLVQRLFLAPERPGDIVRSVVFAGVEIGQGSGLLTAASAELLASWVVGSVCVVDANFGAPSLHRLYGVANDSGFAQVLTGYGDVRDHARQLAQGAENSLWLLSSGSSSEDGASLLTTEARPGRLQELMRAFDYVLFEAAPVTQHPDASILGAQTDGVVLVAEANVTRRHVARAAADTLRASGVRLLGSVLNNRTFPIPEAVYRRL